MDTTEIYCNTKLIRYCSNFSPTTKFYQLYAIKSIIKALYGKCKYAKAMEFSLYQLKKNEYWYTNFLFTTLMTQIFTTAILLYCCPSFTRKGFGVFLSIRFTTLKIAYE